MFTGIIEEVGSVKETCKSSLIISAVRVLEAMQLGDSIAVNGVCLTVIDKNKKDLSVEIEAPISPQGRFGGHFVQGHIDGTGKLISLIPEEDAVIANISAPVEIIKYVVKKCFIAVNGVSLTVTQSDENYFSVSLVTYTRQNTNLGLSRSGDSLNLEVDIIAKYIEKFYTARKKGSISDLLNEYDYLGTR